MSRILNICNLSRRTVLSYSGSNTNNTSRTCLNTSGRDHNAIWMKQLQDILQISRRQRSTTSQPLSKTRRKQTTDARLKLTKLLEARSKQLEKYRENPTQRIDKDIFKNAGRYDNASGQNVPLQTTQEKPFSDNVRSFARQMEHYRSNNYHSESLKKSSNVDQVMPKTEFDHKYEAKGDKRRSQLNKKHERQQTKDIVKNRPKFTNSGILESTMKDPNLNMNIETQTGTVDNHIICFENSFKSFEEQMKNIENANLGNIEVTEMGNDLGNAYLSESQLRGGIMEVRRRHFATSPNNVQSASHNTERFGESFRLSPNTSSLRNGLEPDSGWSRRYRSEEAGRLGEQGVKSVSSQEDVVENQIFSDGLSKTIPKNKDQGRSDLRKGGRRAEYLEETAEESRTGEEEEMSEITLDELGEHSESKEIQPSLELIKELDQILQDDTLQPTMRMHFKSYLKDIMKKMRIIASKDSDKVVDGEQMSGEQMSGEQMSGERVSEEMHLPHIVPFWRPQDIKSIEDFKKASTMVRHLNEKASWGHARERHLEKETKRKSDLYNREVAAYIQVCISAGMLQRAHAFLMTSQLRARRRDQGQNQRVKNPQPKTLNIESYDLLIRAWAKKGELEMIRQLFSEMEINNVTPSMASYAFCLECLGRQKVTLQDITKLVLNDIEKSGYKLQDIAKECKLLPEEWEPINKAISSVVPDFEPSLPERTANYCCDLLQNLDQPPYEHVRNPHQGVLSTEELRARAREQVALETAGTITVKSIVKSSAHHPLQTEAKLNVKAAKKKWRDVLTGVFEKDTFREEVHNKVMGKPSRMTLLPYLKLLPQQYYVDLMMKEIDDIFMEHASFSPSLSVLKKNLGEKVYNLYLAKQRESTQYIERMLRVYDEYAGIYTEAESLGGRNHRQIWEKLLTQHHGVTSLEDRGKMWPNHTMKAVGSFLYKILLSDIKIDSTLSGTEIPAFYTVFREMPKTQHLVEVIKPHPLMARLYQSAVGEDLVFDSSHMPSCVPPRPWCSSSCGGNLLATTDLIKNPNLSLQQVAQLESTPPSQLGPTLDALNTVSSAPWIINKPVLDTMIDVFNNGGDASLDVPSPASTCPEAPKINLEMPIEDKARVWTQQRLVRKQKAEMHSLWMTEIYRLSIANKFRDEIFWFPHNLDFRGRSYPLPPHFNHLGGDRARSILMFAQGKPLGLNGLDWLKIHLINLTGLKKRCSNATRLQFADEIMSDILDSADRPLTGERWWQKSDEPWQTLACCMEVAKATRSPDHTKYICHFPVHQDGSCNGLQHYAALGRDQTGAESVNLYPFTVPKDVYSDVVELVEKERAKDAAKGLEVAKILEGFIARKVIKQTIMTTVYGVTRYGARKQIGGQLEDIDTFPQDWVFDASRYLTSQTFKCLQQMFTATKEIQDWLWVSAELISAICNQSVSWETPLGFPVIQPYFKSSAERDTKPTHKRTTQFTYERPNMTRQRNAFPPNFIHSLDSTHMMLTAIFCLRAGITFVSVHDCFWTHPSDIVTMNKICREQFVALHSEPILENLGAYMLDNFGFSHQERNSHPWVDPISQDFVNHLLSRIPHRGSFELEKVKDSTYFFS